MNAPVNPSDFAPASPPRRKAEVGRRRRLEVNPSDLGPSQPSRLPQSVPRRRWTIGEVMALETIGIPVGSLELIEGELVRKVSKKQLHVLWQRLLLNFLVLQFTRLHDVSAEVSLHLSDSFVPDADVAVLRKGTDIEKMSGGDVLLAVEIADTTRRYDLKIKPASYARHGVAHLWVVDVRGPTLHLFSEPGPDGYGRHEEADAGTAVPLPFAPEVSVRLADLG